MAKFNQKANKSQAGANIQAGAGQFGTEFAAETNAAEVRQQNAASQANKAKNSGNIQQ